MFCTSRVRLFYLLDTRFAHDHFNICHSYISRDPSVFQRPYSYIYSDVVDVSGGFSRLPFWYE